MRTFVVRAVLLIGIALSWLSTGAEAQEFSWAIDCGEPISGPPSFVDQLPEDGLAPGECLRITGAQSGYEGGFSPVIEDHRLLLIVTGRFFQAGTHTVQAFAEVTLPRCRECDGSCAEASGTRITRAAQSIRVEEEQRYLVFDLTETELFPQWELMGADIQVLLQGLAADNASVSTSISLDGWPWCM